jgi:hypothetical protein
LQALYKNDAVPLSPERELRLDATLLLALATQMIILPLERIARPDPARKRNLHVNDAPIDQQLAAAVATLLAGPPAASALFQPDQWRIHIHDVGTEGPLNLAGGIDPGIAAKLNDPAAELLAAQCTTDFVFGILRNALAHGGILFLKQDGLSAREEPVTKFAFVSTDRTQDPRQYRFLRVTMGDFRSFLEAWATWLNHSGAATTVGGIVSVGGDDDGESDDGSPSAESLADA